MVFAAQKYDPSKQRKLPDLSDSFPSKHPGDELKIVIRFNDIYQTGLDAVVVYLFFLEA